MIHCYVMIFKVLRKLTHYSITLYNVKIRYIFSAAPLSSTTPVWFVHFDILFFWYSRKHKVLAHFVI